MESLVRIINQSRLTMMQTDTDNTHEGWKAQKGIEPNKQYGATNPLKRMIDLLGNLALCRFQPGKTVAASLRFSTHENNGAWYQDIVANEIVEMN